MVLSKCVFDCFNYYHCSVFSLSNIKGFVDSEW